MIEPILEAIKANTTAETYPIILITMLGGTMTGIFLLVREMKKLFNEEEVTYRKD